MNKWKVPLYTIYTDAEDYRSIKRVITRANYWAIGREIEEFEETFLNYLSCKYAISFNSGTSALHALLLAYNIGCGDEIIVPSFTFIATANSALFVGAKPVFADIEEETFGLDPASIKEKITPKTRAIMPIHYGGLPCKIKEIRKIASDHNLLLIEDAAESLGAHINGKKAGSFGNAGAFSFCGNKIITTGEGGMVVTDSDETKEKLKLIRSHGRLESESYFLTNKTLDYVALGYNWRISSFTAALGISQMKKIDKVIEMRRRNAQYLTDRLSKIPGISTPVLFEGHFHVYQMYTIRVEGGTVIRDQLREFLAKKKIQSNVYFEPVHLSHFYRTRFGHKRGELPTTEMLSAEVLTLPMYPNLGHEQMDYMTSIMNEFMESI